MCNLNTPATILSGVIDAENWGADLADQLTEILQWVAQHERSSPEWTLIVR